MYKSIALSLVLLLGLLIPSGFSQNSSLIEKRIDLSNTLLEGGWVEVIDNVTILHVGGTYYEMGFQHGHLLQEYVQQDLRAFLTSSELTQYELLEIWYQMEPYVPQQYLDEMQGLADGANVTYEDVAAAYMVIVWGDRGCFGFAAWGPATKNGYIYHARSFDLPFNIVDPISGRYVHENTVLIVRHPNEGIPSVTACVAGATHGGGGVNAEGITLGQQVCWSSDQTYAGIPGQIRVQMVLDTAHNLEEATTILTSNKTLGWNFIVSDTSQNVACVVEVSANHSYIGFYNSSTEQQKPFWKLDHIVRRTNFFIDRTIADTQRHLYDPSGIKGFVNYLLTGEFFWVVYQSYRVISNDLEVAWGQLDLNTSISLLREGYRGDTNLLLKLVVFLAEGTSFNRAWNQWVVCPATNEIAVCFASHDTIAYYNPVHYFDLEDLFTAISP